MPFVLRPAAAEDVPFLWTMLIEAAYWRPGAPRLPRDVLMRDDHMRRYLEGWGREGDAGMVALSGATPIGAAWYRHFSPARPGWGFLDGQTPEVAIAVAEGWRGRGVGTALLRALARIARIARRQGHTALSLSVDAENPARRLYARLGYRQVERVGGSWTMRLPSRRIRPGWPRRLTLSQPPSHCPPLTAAGAPPRAVPAPKPPPSASSPSDRPSCPSSS